jgi:hypothetical protein
MSGFGRSRRKPAPWDPPAERSGAGVASGGANTHPGHPPRNGDPMKGRRPYGGFCTIENPKPAAGADRPGVRGQISARLGTENRPTRPAPPNATPCSARNPMQSFGRSRFAPRNAKPCSARTAMQSSFGRPCPTRAFGQERAPNLAPFARGPEAPPPPPPRLFRRPLCAFRICHPRARNPENFRKIPKK